VDVKSALVLVGLVLLPCAVSGCGVTRRVGRPPEMSGQHVLEVTQRAADRCIHGMTGRDSPYRVELPGPVTEPELVLAVGHFPPAVRRTAVAAGIEPLLARIVLERDRSMQLGRATPELLAMRDELSARMYTLETQLTAMEFEVDCVRGLINRRLSDYAEGETDRQLALTIASLVVGAAGAVAAGVWDFANGEVSEPAVPEGPLVVSIAGAVGAAALGTAVLAPVPQPILFEHEHNVLRPVLLGADEDYVFPTFVFRLLTLPAAEGEETPRDELLSAWSTMIGDAISEGERPLAAEILYGEGGVYDPQLLRLHQDMLEELGATLDGLARDIDMLASTIANVLAADLPATEESAEVP
jgi:hypothetical protein